MNRQSGGFQGKETYTPNTPNSPVVHATAVQNPKSRALPPPGRGDPGLTAQAQPKRDSGGARALQGAAEDGERGWGSQEDPSTAHSGAQQLSDSSSGFN